MVWRGGAKALTLTLYSVECGAKALTHLVRGPMRGRERGRAAGSPGGGGGGRRAVI